MIAPPPPETSAGDVDVLVIGAGPAGSMAALMAARSGANVLIVDKAAFPRHKVCGCCLSSAAIMLLRDAGFGRQLDALGGVLLDRLDLRIPGSRCELALSAGRAISRAVLDQMLVDAAVQAGARFIDGCKATLGPAAIQRRHVQLTRNGVAATLRGRIVIAADGLRSGSARTHTARDSRIGISAMLTQVPRNWDDRAIVMSCGTHGYVGLVRIDANHLDLAAAVDPAWLRSIGGAHKACASVLEACGVPVPGDLPGAGAGPGARFTGTPLLTCRPADVAEDRLLRVGDAAGYVEPFTGEGIAWALASGMAAGRLAGETLRRGEWHPAAEDQWRQQHCSLLASRQRRCRTIAKLLRSPPLLRAGTRLLRHLPGVAAPVIRRIHAPFALDLHAPTT